MLRINRHRFERSVQMLENEIELFQALLYLTGRVGNSGAG
jgi:hypothetical protein